MEERGYLCELMTLVMRGSLPANDALNSIIRRWNLTRVPEFTLPRGVDFLGEIALMIFAEHNPLDWEGGKPLGQLAFELLITITGSQEQLILEVVNDLPCTIPLMSIHGQIEEKYMEVTNKARHIDTVGKGV